MPLLKNIYLDLLTNSMSFPFVALAEMVSFCETH